MADQLTDKETREIWCLVQLREALGDPLGKLMQDELVQLARDVVAERDRLRKDAERYLWLRNEAWGGNNKRGPHLVEFKPGYVPSRFTDLAEEAADAAVDAAMALHAKVSGPDGAAG